MIASINNIRLSFIDEGRGQPVLLVHGFPFDHTIWQPQIETLSKNFRVIAPDLRGHGESAAPSGIYNMEIFADDLNMLLEERQCGPVVLVGHSMGGYISFAFYRRFPEKVRGLVLFCTRAGADSEEGKAGREHLAQRAEREGAVAVAEQMLPKMLAAATTTSRPDLVPQVRHIMLATSINGLAGSLRGMAARPSALDLLPEITAPTMVIAGEEDLMIPTLEAEAMARAIPNAQLYLIPHAGHLASLENPVEVNARMRNFLAALG